MPLIEPDFTETGLIDNGTYPAEIKNVEAGTSNAGKPKAIIHLEVDVNGKPRKKEAHLPVTGKGAYQFANMLRASGFAEDADRFSKPGGGSFDTDKLIGQKINIVIEQGMDQNEQMRDNIKSFLKA